MTAFNFQSTCTNALTIRIEAKDEDEAWYIFDLKNEILESMGVYIPRKETWSIVTRY